MVASKKYFWWHREGRVFQRYKLRWTHKGSTGGMNSPQLARGRVSSSSSSSSFSFDSQNIDPGGLEASLLHIINDHHHASLKLRDQAGKSQIKIVTLFVFWFVWFFIYCDLILIGNRESEERRDSKRGASFGSVGGRCEWWSTGIVYQRETNWAWNSSISGDDCTLHETDRSMAHCHACYQLRYQGPLVFFLLFFEPGMCVY